MTFGENIKTIMTVSGIKGNQLANALGYDTSYISRWLTGEKLPSFRREDSLFRKLADYVVSMCSPSLLRVIASELNLAQPLETAEQYAKAIEMSLEQSYLCQKGIQTKYKSLASGGSFMLKEFNQVIVDTKGEAFSSHLAEYIFSAFSGNETSTVEILTTEQISYIPHLETDLVTALRDLCNSEHFIHIQHVILRKYLEEKGIQCCRGLVHVLKSIEGMKYDIFITDDPDVDETELAVLKDLMYLRKIRDAFAPYPYLLLSTDNWLVSSAGLAFEKLIRNTYPAIQYTTNLHLHKGRHLFNYMMQDRFLYIMNMMHPLYMSESFYREMYDKHHNSSVKWEFTFGARMYSAKNKTAILFKSAFIDYLYYGRIVFGEEIVTFSVEERIRHLQGLCEALRRNPELNVTILEDNNPLLCYSEVDSTLYLTEQAAHITFHNHRHDSIVINDIGLIRAFCGFAEALCELPDTVCIREQRLIEYVESSIHILEAD